jgi:hypothetical protein
MISRNCEENDIRVMFSPYGQIEDCTVLRDSNSKSRGKFRNLNVDVFVKVRKVF